MQTKSLSHLYLCLDYIKYSIPLIFTFCVVFLSLAYLLILHCWDEYRRGAKGNVGAQISTRSDCPDSELHQLSSRQIHAWRPAALFPLSTHLLIFAKCDQFCSLDVCIVLFGLLLPVERTINSSICSLLEFMLCTP